MALIGAVDPPAGENFAATAAVIDESEMRILGFLLASTRTFDRYSSSSPIALHAATGKCANMAIIGGDPMADTHAHHDDAAHVAKGANGNPLGRPAMILTLVTGVALAHPSVLLLPLLSALLVTAGFALSAVNWFRFRRSPNSMIEHMTLPGLLVFFGFAAAIFSDPDAVVQSLSHLR